MRDVLRRLARLIMARPSLAPLNRRLVTAGLRGLGLLNYENERVSGERHFLQVYLAQPDAPIVLDVGANAGHYAQAVLAVAPRARVFAFEPHPRTFERLRQNLHGTPVEVLPLACSAVSGQALLFDYANEDGSEHATLHQGVIEAIHQGQARSTAIQTTTIDEFTDARKLPRIDLLKIDTEGHEYQVLLGARKTLEAGKIGAIQMEFAAMNVISRVFFKDFCGLLPEYDFFRLLPNGFLPLWPYDPLLCELFAYQNIVAVPRSRHWPP